MRILIVEDDHQLGDALATGLRQLGHAVDWFDSGEHADAAVAAAAYDAIVLDLGLPGQDGMSCLRRWRDRGHDLPVLILTARDAVQQRVAGLDAGADDYLVKPITIDELSARLRALQRRLSGRSQPVWTQGELAFDPAARQASWRGVPVELTAREAAVLETLMSNAQRLWPKAALQEKLYGWGGTEPESNSLEVHVSHLRRKLHPSVVKTVRGVGYALGACDGQA